MRDRFDRSRVAVTGIGVTCALGGNRREFRDAAMAGRCGIGELDLFESEGCLSHRAARVNGLRRPG